MAKKNRLDQAAGESIGGFFSRPDENKNEQEIKNVHTTSQNSQIAPEKVQTIKNTSIRENAEKTANIKPQKQSFSFRADKSKIESWKLFAEAIGTKDLGELWTAAIEEYISNHPLTENQQEIYTLKMKAAEIARK